MSKYSHFEMCEKIFGDRYKWYEHKQECTLFTRSDMWDKLVEQQQQIAELQKQLKASEQLQNQKVIEVLDKVKYDLLDISSPYWQYFAKSGNAFMTYEDIEQWVKEFIDNKIKSLRGEE